MCDLHIYNHGMRAPSLKPTIQPAAVAASPDADALVQAINALLAPLARLAIAKGLPCAVVEGQLRQAFVSAARDAHPSLPPHRMVSRIATATGLNRREVTRLTQAVESPVRRRPLAAEVFARWASDSQYRDARGRPRTLPRQGKAPSFETLAQSVTRDVHPRSLLDELLRLKLAVLDEGTDTVALLRDGFVPSGDRVRMLGFLSDNVGDHLAASVDNVLADGRRHFEQAVFADGLSAASMGAVRAIVGPQWKGLLEALVPLLEKMIEADAEIPTAERRRVRIGLYAYDDATPEARQAAPPPAATAPKRRPRKT